MKNEYIDISTVNPELKNKIRQNITNPTDTVYWHIRFNIPLDPASVNNDTMCVMDENGKMLASYISYLEDLNVIVITPLMPYKASSPYILTVFREVRSINKQQLKEDIQVVFKLKEAKITDFTVLKGKELMNVSSVEKQRQDVIKRQQLGMSEEKLRENDRLYPAPLSINFIIGVLGLVLIVISIVFTFLIGIVISLLLLIGGITHIFLQLSNTKSKSIRMYNEGVKLYNESQYKSAIYRFENALMMDTDNEYARFGITRAAQHK